MLKFGKAPYLECSSKGDRRFSAFHARIARRDGRSIEDLYQSAKTLPDGRTGLNWREAKGQPCVNIEECRELYAKLWQDYFEENPDLLEYAREFNGFSDIYGQAGHACQAEEIHKLANIRESARPPQKPSVRRL